MPSGSSRAPNWSRPPSPVDHWARALDKAAGGDATGDREDDLWERITAERDRYWTATGQVKAERTALSNRVAEAASRVAALEAALRSLDDDAAAVDRLVR